MPTSLPLVLQRVRAAGYTVFEKGAFNLNMIVERAPHGAPDKFDDKLTLVYRDFANGPWLTHEFVVTADPGLYWLHNPMNAKGTAAIAPGQYKGAFVLGKHAGTYECLVQTPGVPLLVYRDADRNSLFDWTGLPVPAVNSALQIHHAGTSSTVVGKWSAGCIVFAVEAQFSAFMQLVKKSMTYYGPKITLTVLP